MRKSINDRLTYKGWSYRIERDILALGSIVFYFLVLGRSLIGPYIVFAFQISVSAVILFIIFLFNKNFNTYVARGLILTVSTIYFYSDLIYTIFAIVIFILMDLSAYHLYKSKGKIIKGILFGCISYIIAFSLSAWLLTGIE